MLMDVLVEMTPGSGWLARENKRVVFIPGAEPVDAAHDVIEPLLVAGDVNESFEMLQSWILRGTPLPPMALISLESSVRFLAHEIDEILTVNSPNSGLEPVAKGEPAQIQSLGEISSLIANDPNELASGMLVEGVVRAAGCQLHFHRGWGSETGRITDVEIPHSLREIEVDGRRISIGNGIVLGRWPYSHPNFDAALEPVILDDPAVSRLHAIITPTSNGVGISDCGSHNGTKIVRQDGAVESVPQEATLLASGDQVRLGDSVLSFL